MIGFLSVDMLNHSKLKHSNKIHYFLMAASSSYPYETGIVSRLKNVTIMDNLIPTSNAANLFVKPENRGNFEACVEEYSNYLSENGSFESLETIIKTYRGDKKDMIFLCYFDDIGYMEALARILKRKYGIHVVGSMVLCGRSMYFPDYIAMDNAEAFE